MFEVENSQKGWCEDELSQYQACLVFLSKDQEKYVICFVDAKPAAPVYPKEKPVRVEPLGVRGRRRSSDDIAQICCLVFSDMACREPRAGRHLPGTWSVDDWHILHALWLSNHSICGDDHLETWGFEERNSHAKDDNAEKQEGRLHQTKK